MPTWIFTVRIIVDSTLQNHDNEQDAGSAVQWQLDAATTRGAWESFEITNVEQSDDA